MIDDARVRQMAADLSEVPGIVAVTLGGSRARGTHRVDSDVDLGLYYERAALDLTALTRLAHRWSDRPIELAGPGGWGPWVDGGGWLTVEGTPVDWILRDVERVGDQCRRAQHGEYAFATQPGHPFGFLDVAYAGEAAVGVPLADRRGVLAGLRALVTPYPPALRSAFVAALWQVDFLLDGAAKGAARGDVTYVSLCAAHVALLVAHAWHAAAGDWAVNEKGLVPDVATLDIDSRGFSEFVPDALATLGRTPAELTAAMAKLRLIPRPTGPQ